MAFDPNHQKQSSYDKGKREKQGRQPETIKIGILSAIHAQQICRSPTRNRKSSETISRGSLPTSSSAAQSKPIPLYLCHLIFASRSVSGWPGGETGHQSTGPLGGLKLGPRGFRPPWGSACTVA